MERDREARQKWHHPVQGERRGLILIKIDNLTIRGIVY
jgi:hypothetical protein